MKRCIFILDRGRTMLLAATLIATAAGVRAAADGALPIPPAAQIERAERFVRGIYKNDYAQKGKSDRQEFVEKLLKGADDARDDAAMRYVMRLEARDVASMAADLQLMDRAIDELSAEFAVDRSQITTDGLTAGARGGIRTPAEAQEIAGRWFDLLDQSLTARKFELAGKAATGAESGLKFVKEKARADKIRSQAKAAREGVQLEQSAGAARLELSAHPDDPAANLAIGKLLCFAKNDWKEGLPHLAAGTKEAPLKKIIDQDLALPTDVAARVALADGWFDLAAAQPDGVAKEAYRTRAAYWYGLAQEKATGLLKAKIKLRLEALPAVTDPDAAAAPDEPAAAPTSHAAAKPRRIVLICDGRGAMLGVFPDVELNIADAISKLDKSQSFTVLLAHETGIGAMFPKLTPANAENKKKLAGWLTLDRFSGRSTPLPAIAAALDLNPDAIWFYTEGDFADDAAVGREIAKLNRVHRVSINLLIVRPQDSPHDFPEMRQIAKDNRASFASTTGVEVGRLP